MTEHVQHGYACTECPYVGKGANGWHNFHRHFTTQHPDIKLQNHTGNKVAADTYKLSFCVRLDAGKATQEPAAAVQDLPETVRMLSS